LIHGVGDTEGYGAVVRRRGKREKKIPRKLALLSLSERKKKPEIIVQCDLHVTKTENPNQI
jgi:hypothetical protein